MTLLTISCFVFLYICSGKLAILGIFDCVIIAMQGRVEDVGRYRGIYQRRT